MYCNVPTHFNQNDEILTVVSSKSWSFRLTITCAIKVVSANPTHGEVYTIHHYVIKFVSDYIIRSNNVSLKHQVLLLNRSAGFISMYFKDMVFNATFNKFSGISWWSVF
jgi:hypothetical protein